MLDRLGHATCQKYRLNKKNQVKTNKRTNFRLRNIVRWRRIMISEIRRYKRFLTTLFYIFSH